MKTFLQILNDKVGIHIALTIAYCLAVTLPHERVGLFFMSFLEHLPRHEMVGIVLGIGIGIMVLLSIPFWLKLRRHPGRKNIILALLLTLIMVVAVYSLLFVLPTETAHFPQYAMMAILLFPFTWRFDETLIWATLMGAMDEGYQYYYLSPERTHYFDFNDVLTDLLGAALGLIYLWAFLKNEIRKPRLFHKSPAWMIYGLLSIIVLFLYFLGDPLDLVRTPETSFWTELRNGVRFHVLRPEIGILIITLVLLGYRMFWKKNMFS